MYLGGMKILNNIFGHKSASTQEEERREAKPLRIEGVAPAPMTPEPDDAEIAAQAILELMIQKGADKKNDSLQDGKQPHSDERDSAYYEKLASRMRKAREQQRQQAIRFIAFCEEQLKKTDLPVHGSNSLELIEAELYKRIDVVEREKGDLKRRWQHCLAEVTVRLMNI